MPDSPGLARGLLLAALYLLLGVLGLTLAIPPGYASPIFPAAGLALAAALHFGRGAVPCIGLGSLLLNLGQAAHADALTSTTVLAALGIASGAMLQAQLGQWWVRNRLGDGWRRLESEARILALLFRGGVLGCLVSASVAVTVLSALEVITVASIPFSWWTWYTGDLLGVAIFAPLALMFMAPDSELSREQRRRIVVPICVALLLSLLVYGAASHVEQRHLRQRVEHEGAAIAKQIQDRLITHQTILASLAHVLDASPDFSYSRFEHFTQATLAENPDLFALSFNDAVPRQRLRAYEAEISESSPLGPFSATERNAAGQLVPVGDRPDYVIVRYIVPLQGNAPALGFDINSEPVRREAIGRAVSSGRMVVTAPIRLVQENTVRMGVLVLAPVYRPEGELKGLAVAVIKVDQLVEIATRGLVPQGLALRVRDARVGDDGLQFYASAPASGEVAGYRWRTPLKLADRPWELELWATDAYINEARHWVSWAVGVVALLFTVLLQVYLHGLTGRVLTMRRQNDALLEKQAGLQLAETVYANTADAIVVTDTAGHIVSINPAFTHITGYRLPEVIGKKMSVVSSGLYGREFYESLWKQLLAERKWQGELVNCRKNGELYTEQLTITAVLGQDGEVLQYVGTFSDITEKKSAQNRIEFMAFHDALTGLPNRTLGRKHADEAIARARRHGLQVGVVFMDLDNFKLVNDRYGHSVGDLLLQAVSERLRRNVRAEDTLCRLSGDEFMLILGDVAQLEHVAARCEHLLAELAQPYDIDGRLLTTSLSAGIAVYPNDGEDAEELLRKADTAMFEAKRDGRDTYLFFDAAMNQRVLAFVETRDALAEALQNDEFELFYQPQIRLVDQAVAGVEALIRWRHPERGLIGPGQFIPVAEQSGLIVPIGAWALQQACRQMQRWREAGLPMQTIAVNLSAVQFRSGDIARTITDALADAGLAPACLELELTESILISNQEKTLARIALLKELGVRLSIDDFGTGYSSMAYLKRFHADKIKIDSSFAARVGEDAEDTAIVRSIIQMAEALGMETTAEGIERGDAVAVLREMGCTQIQGYYYAKPMPEGEFAAWVSSYTR